MDGFSGSLSFVVDKGHDVLIQKHKAHVKFLFGVTVKLENTQMNKRWISLKGPDDQLSKAKEYILAMSIPEITSILDNVLNNPHFTKDKQSEIERKSSAVLLRCDDKSATSLQIKGSAFSVAVAKSLIEEELSTARKETSVASSSNERVIMFEEGAEEDCFITEARLMSNLAENQKSPVFTEPLEDNKNLKSINHPGSALMTSKSILQHGNTASMFSPHAREQQAYLRNMALALKYDKDSVEDALLKFDMNDVIPPASFISAVIEISKLKASSSNQIAETNFTNIDKDLDASVICLDSSDEETFVLRPFQDDNQFIRQTNPNDTIVLSSDDDQENEIPEMANARQRKLLALGKCKSQPGCLTRANKEPDMTCRGPSKEQSLVFNPDHRAVSSSLAKMPISKKSPSDLFVNDTPEPNMQVSEEMRLRQEYLNCLMRDSPKGPRTGPRYIVIDGCNVAMSHGNNVQFSALGIEICLKYFLSKGHLKITAFVPEWRRYTNQISSNDRAILEKLNKAGFVKFTPARRVGNRTIASYDDRFILNLAVKEEGIIVSNDQYRDLQDEQAGYKDAVMNRLLQYTFVGDHFMPPDDPLGRFGPSLDHFLHYPIQPTGPGVEATASSVPVRNCQDGTVPRSAIGKNQEAPLELPFRTKTETEKLFLELIKVFPEPHQLPYVRKVLANHKRENDLNRLSIYCINAMAN